VADELTLPWCFDDEHVAWQKTMQDYASRMVAPGARDRDLAGEPDPVLIAELGRLGAFGLLVPEAYGGSGADLRSLCIALEELARVDSSVAATVHVQNVCAALF
jgi:butyryl-CoA dehydrogenase